MGKAFAVTFGLLLAVFIFIIIRVGYFKPVTIASGEQGPFLLVYKVHRGPYHEIAPMIDEVEAFFKDNGLPCPLAFGRFLHDPNTVPHDRLESHVGCAFMNSSPRLQELIESGGFLQDPLPKTEYVVGHFEGSPSMGPIKVYPYVEDWMNKYGYQIQRPVIELYQTTGEDSVHTRYLFNYK
jgi:AraC family transcriptional regulator